jgi:hypothetical protein
MWSYLKTRSFINPPPGYVENKAAFAESFKARRNRPRACALRSRCQSDRKRESRHRGGKRFVVRADEILTAFLELERAIHQFAVDLVS